MRVQVEQARRRQYPNASDAPAKWLALVSARLQDVALQLDQGHVEGDRLKAENLLVDINRCYDDLQVLSRADTTQVADYLVRGLRRWFALADPDCDYLFTSGINFEVEPLYDDPPAEISHQDYEKALAAMPKVLYRVTMPGGALGAGFHIPLVSHEVGHVLIFRLDRQGEDSLIRTLAEPALTDQDSQKAYENWIAEIIADTICGFIGGPAGFFALHEKLRGGGDTPNTDYPDNYLRVSSLGTYIRDRFQRVFSARSIEERHWASWPIQSGDYFVNASSGPYMEISRRLAEKLPRIRETAVSLARRFIPHLEYTPQRFAADLNSHLKPFLHAIPPFETMGQVREDLRDRYPTDLASILNVGWFIAAFALDELRNSLPLQPMSDGQLLICLDQLILKAIELSEIRRDWTNA